MRIALVTYKVNYGGIGTYLLSLTHELNRRKHDTHIICTDGPGTWFGEAQKKFKINCIPFGIFGWIPFGRIIHAYRVGKYIEKGNYDWVIINNSYFAQIASGRYNSATIFNVIHNQLPSVVKVACIHPEHTQLYICISNKILEEAERYLIPSKLKMIPNGIKIPSSNQLNLRVEHSSPIKIIFVGRIHHHQKGVFHIPVILEKLLKKSIAFTFTIIGDGEDRDELIRRLDEKKLDQHYRYLGLMDHNQIYNEFLTHHIFLFPSYYEGLPLTLLEAMSCGCVPVSSNIKGCTDICIENNFNGFLVSIADEEHFASKIIELYHSKEKWDKMRSESIITAEKKFSIEAMTDAYVEQFKIHKKNIYPPQQSIFISWKEIIPFDLLMIIKKSILPLLKIKNE